MSLGPDEATKAAAAWYQLVTHRSIDTSLLSPLVVTSWQRSLQAGVDPQRAEDSGLPADLLDVRRQHMHLFLEQVSHLYQELKESVPAPLPYALLVTDAEGYLLAAYLPEDRPVLPFLRPGTCWREDCCGTNGIGTSLELGRPVIIRGAEHYRQALHQWCSVGVPGGSAGSPAGVLGFLFPLTAANDLTVALACMAARAVEKGWQLAALQQQSSLSELIVQTTANAVMTVDTCGRINFVNQAACNLFNLRPEEVLGRKHVDIFHHGRTYTAGGEYACKLTEALQTRRAFIQVEKTYPHLAPDRVFSADALPLRTADGQIVGAMALYRDITAQKQAEADLAATKQALENLISTDPVTGLANRRYFEERLEEELARARHFHTYGSLLLINVDHFRYYNDHLGPEAADELLRQIGELIKAQVRPIDLVGRITGDEFAVFLLDTAAQEGMLLSENIRQAIGHHNFPQESLSRQVTVSVGLATYPTNSITRNGLIHAARQALMQAKQTTRNKVELYFGILDHVEPQHLANGEREIFNTIKTLITVINAKDSYTYGHTERAVRYARKLGQKMALSTRELDDLLYGAFLHDVGKIEISRNLLNKAAPLMPEEWEILKRHPVWGAEIVESVPLLMSIAPLIRQHHERYDGRGYPDGLRKTEISVLSRILTLVDSFDAMTTDRPYKKARDIRQAIEELERCQETQFDPDIVPVFIEILPEITREMQLGR